MRETLDIAERAPLMEEGLSFPMSADELLTDPVFTEELLQQIWLNAYKGARARGASHEVAEDLASDGVVTVWERRSKCDGTNPRGWANTVTINAATSTLRRMSHPAYGRPGTEADTVIAVAEKSRMGQSAEVEYFTQDADTTWRLRAQTAFEAIGMGMALDACILIMVDKLPYKEAAAQLGIGEGTIKSWVHRVRTKFRAEHGDDPFATFATVRYNTNIEHRKRRRRS